MQDEQLERGAQSLDCIVACGVVAGGDPCEQTRQYGELAHQNVCNHATLGFDENGVKVAFIAAHVVPGSPECGAPPLVHKNPSDYVKPSLTHRAPNPPQ